MASEVSRNTTFYNSLPPSHCTLFKTYAQTVKKLCAQHTRKQFLQRCRRHGLQPAHIQNSFRCTHSLLEDASPFRQKLQKTTDRFTRAIVSIEIKDSHYKIHQLEKKRASLISQITQLSASHIHTTFFESQERFIRKQRHRALVKTSSKIQRLLERAGTENKMDCNDAWIQNIANAQIPLETKILLGYGPKFALPAENINEIPYFKIIADLESIFKLDSDPITAAACRNQCTNVLQNHLSKTKNGTMKPSPNSVDHFLIQALRTSRRFVRENPNIYIVPADKGNKTVIMDKHEYEDKMLTLVSDTDVYERINTNCTSRIQMQNNKLVNALFNQKLIDSQTRTQLISYHATCPRIYGLPKIHKQGNPLRAILSCINCPTYDLSKYLANILRQSINQDKYNIANSYQFCTLINNVTLPDGYVLVSFDVVSLFTCIPRNVAIDAVKNNWSEIEKHTTIKNRDMFVELIAFNLTSSYFTHRGQFYKQLSGTAMGNPLSPALADLVMEMLLDYALGKMDIEIPFFKKYVDDLITALPVDKIEQVKSALNSFHANIQFTCEIENNGQLPYLDMMLIRTPQQNVVTDWYEKPSASGRILNFYSFHPLTQKLNVASGFIGRVFKLSTHRSENENRELARQYLRKNNYPVSLINRLINRHIHGNETNTSSNSQQPKIYRALHYIANLTPALARIVRNKFPNVSLGFKCAKSNQLLFSRLKDATPLEEKRNIIYRIPCSDCAGSYIGLTTQQLKQRLSGHRSLINRYTDLKSADPNQAREREEEFKKTALMVHAIDLNHKFDLTNTTILDQDNRLSALQVLEMCHITCDTTTINFRTDTNNLNAAYSGLLHSLKREKG